MEYVKGGQLDRLFKKELTERQVSEVVKNILEAVNYVHERDYIHRDLKPQNILMQDKNGLEIKIVDFGLSAMHRLKMDE